VLDPQAELREHLLVGPKHLAEQLRAEVGHRRAHRHARAEAAERQELDRERLGCERQAIVASGIFTSAARASSPSWTPRPRSIAAPSVA